MEEPKTGYLLEIQTAGQKRVVPLERDEPVALGRDPEGEVVLEDRKVSREHARLTWVEGLPCLTDLGSVNGTVLNGRRLPPRIPHSLNDGDVLQIGDYTLTWRQKAAAQVEREGPALLVSTPEGQQVFPLVGDKLTLGREAGNEIQIENRLVSRWHALLVRSGDGYEIIDLGGTNGLSDGEAQISRRVLTDGTVLWITRHISLTYLSRAGREAPRTGEGTEAAGVAPEAATRIIAPPSAPQAPPESGGGGEAEEDPAGGAPGPGPSPAENDPAPPEAPGPPAAPVEDALTAEAPGDEPALPEGTVISAPAADGGETRPLAPDAPAASGQGEGSETPPVDGTLISAPPPGATPAAPDNPTLLSAPPGPPEAAQDERGGAPPADGTVISAPPPGASPISPDNPTLLSAPPGPPETAQDEGGGTLISAPSADGTLISAPPPGTTPAAPDNPTLLSASPGMPEDAQDEGSGAPPADGTLISAPPPGATPAAPDNPTLLSAPPGPPEAAPGEGSGAPPADGTLISAPPPGATPAAPENPTLLSAPPGTPETAQGEGSGAPSADGTLISAPATGTTPILPENPTLLSTPPGTPEAAPGEGSDSPAADGTLISAPATGPTPISPENPTLLSAPPGPPETAPGEGSGAPPADGTVISAPATGPTAISPENPTPLSTSPGTPEAAPDEESGTLNSAPAADGTVITTPPVETPPAAGEADATLLDAPAPEAAGGEPGPASGAARLAVHLPDRTWEVPLLGDSYSIGREAGNDIVIDHPSISRRHARLERRREGFVLQDSGSTNGLWLEGGASGRGSGRVDSRTLEDGDTLRIGRARLVFKAAFRLEELTLAGVPLQRGTLARRRPVLIVPGIMGSELWLGSERLWPSPRGLLHPEMAAFPGDPRVEARCLVKEVMLVPGFIKLEQYSRLGDYLEAGLGYERGVDLLEFPYDWRQDLRISARRLGEALEAWQVQGPVTIIAHSMGSLISRYFIERLGGRRMVERMILLGGPHYGAPKMISTLVRGPGLLPFGLMNERLRALLTSFPSGYQMIPTYACVEDQDGRQVNLLEDESWATGEQATLLRQARAFRRELPSRSSLPTVSIFGYGLKTISKVKTWRGREGRIEKMDFLEEAAGDGTVPAASAVLRRSEIHPVRQDHGSLYVDNDVKMRLKLELTRPREA